MHMLLGGIDQFSIVLDGVARVLGLSDYRLLDRWHVGLKAVVDVRVNSPDCMNLKNPTQQAAHSKIFW